MKTNYITGDAETSIAWNKMITTLEATQNEFGGSPSGFHLEVD
jgi:hypothetical protein